MDDFERIFLTGDKHGDFFDLMGDSVRYGFTERDLLIILGDVGVNYYGKAFGGSKDRELKERLSQIPSTVLCIHGNHEMRPTSWEIREKYRRIDWMGDTAYVEDAFPRLIFAEDGSRYAINGREFLVIGGAYSVDKWYRVLRRLRWFPDEQLSEEEKDSIREKVRTHGNREDIILAHTCPMDHQPIECFLAGIDQSRVDTTTEEFLQEITDSIEYNRFYCGHWHTDKQDSKIRFLFHDIVMLEDTTEEEK